jgi:hypothetical protein
MALFDECMQDMEAHFPLVKFLWPLIAITSLVSIMPPDMIRY